MIDYTVSTYFRELVFNQYPILYENETYRRFFLYLLFPRYDYITGSISISANLLAGIENKKYDRNYNAAKFLQHFSRDVFSLRWSRWDYGSGKAREITTLSWNIEEELRRERLGEYDSSGKCWFLSGQAVTKETLRQARYIRSNKAMEHLRAFSHNPDMVFIGEYLNSRPINTFTKTIQKNMNEARGVAAKRIISYDRDARKEEFQEFDRILRILRSLEDYPQDHYAALDSGTSRLFTIDSGMQSLPQDVRRALTKGWIECDLAAVQTAINAKIWNVETVHSFLLRGKPLWETVVRDLGLEFTPRIKRIIKKSFYTLQYGGQVKTVRNMVAQERVESFNVSRFLDHWIVQDMLAGRDHFVERMKQQGGAMDYYGTWHSLDTLEYKSILSHISTSYEMALIRPIFDLAATRDDFHILLYQFDGVSLYILDKTREEYILSLIQKAVFTKASSLGIATFLECTLLPED